MALSTGNIVRSKLAPRTDPVQGIILSISTITRIDGTVTTLYNVSWVDHSGDPANETTSHFEEELTLCL